MICFTYVSPTHKTKGVRNQFNISAKPENIGATVGTVQSWFGRQQQAPPQQAPQAQAPPRPLSPNPYASASQQLEQTKRTIYGIRDPDLLQTMLINCLEQQ